MEDYSGGHMSSEGEDFDLIGIVTSSTARTREISTEAYEYLISLCDDKLLKRLTRSQAKDIAGELLGKMGLVDDE